MKRSITLLASAVFLFLGSDKVSNGAGDDEDLNPGVKTLNVTDISSSSATFNGKLNIPEQIAADFDFGFELCTSENFEEETTTHYTVGTYLASDMTFQYKVEYSLKPLQTYYVRTYMLNSKCLYYGAVMRFQTSEFTPEYVDLGLSVNWATCNVGAISPKGYGDYFAWGETEPYYNGDSQNPTGWKSGKSSGYWWSSYKYCKGGPTTMTKYCNNSSYGFIGFTDSKTVLDPEDDVAHVNWGGDWRMPTKAEFDELCNSSNCIWTWTMENGVNGYKVVSKKSGYEGNYIFLPAAGFLRGTYLYDVGSYCNYWSSSLCTDYPPCAYYLYFSSGYCGTSSIGRSFGRSVRPVCL